MIEVSMLRRCFDVETNRVQLDLPPEATIEQIIVACAEKEVVDWKWGKWSEEDLQEEVAEIFWKNGIGYFVDSRETD
jgi:hypothetical protein